VHRTYLAHASEAGNALTGRRGGTVSRKRTVRRALGMEQVKTSEQRKRDESQRTENRKKGPLGTVRRTTVTSMRPMTAVLKSLCQMASVRRRSASASRQEKSSANCSSQNRDCKQESAATSATSEGETTRAEPTFNHVVFCITLEECRRPQNQ
jgi:hypothetical protein